MISDFERRCKSVRCGLLRMFSGRAINEGEGRARVAAAGGGNENEDGFRVSQRRDSLDSLTDGASNGVDAATWMQRRGWSDVDGATWMERRGCSDVVARWVQRRRGEAQAPGVAQPGPSLAFSGCQSRGELPHWRLWRRLSANGYHENPGRALGGAWCLPGGGHPERARLAVVGAPFPADGFVRPSPRNGRGRPGHSTKGC